jgi:prolyl-tRNA synthetase
MSNFESLTQLFQSLSFNTSSVAHTPVTNPTEWTDALTQVKDQAPSEFQFTKTIVVKPKTAKTAPVTPVMIIALDNTQHNLSTLGKHLSLKEMRLATPELLEEFFKVNKDSSKFL